jgi:hypothetical protein
LLLLNGSGASQRDYTGAAMKTTTRGLINKAGNNQSDAADCVKFSLTLPDAFE